MKAEIAVLIATSLAFALAAGAECAAQTLKSSLIPSGLRCEYRTDPEGIDSARPRLSWVVASPERSQKQTAYRVLVASDLSTLKTHTGDLWDSGKVQSDKTAQIEYAGAPLASARRYFWQVMVWDANGAPSAWSKPGTWVTGLQPSDWQAKWIGFNCVAPHFRKEFEVDSTIRSAYVYATAQGLYELRLNGQKVGHDYLTPGYYDYHKRVYYNTYDVTGLVKQGYNAIGAILGDGWFAGYLSFTGSKRWYGGDPKLMAQLVIEYTDGSIKTVVTDDTWKASAGPILEGDLLMGCTYDARKEMPGWDTVKFDAAKWSPAVVSESPNLPISAKPDDAVRQFDTFPAVKVTEPKPGVYVFDLGQNMVGWVKLRVTGKSGQKLVLRHAEMLNPDGTLYTKSLRSAKATDTYYLKGGKEEVLEPNFTFHGFRYVEITGLESAPKTDMVTGIVIHSDIPRTGQFGCSNQLVNQLFHNIIWGQKGNYIEVPTDCPQRDERLGWTGDAQFFMPTAAYNFDVSAFFTKWLVDLVQDSQYGNGAFGCVAPDMKLTPGGDVAWGDAAVICTHRMLMVYGDTQIVDRHWANLTRYMDYLQKNSKDFVRGQGAFGDWLNLGGGAKSEVIGTAYFAYDARLMAEMAAATGRNEDAARYSKLADDITTSFRQHFVDNKGHILESSQTGYALAFTMGLLPDNAKKAAADAFEEDIKGRDWHLATGFIGTPRLLPSLTIAGKADAAYKLLMQETFPSWLYQVKLGATTMWERWDGWTPEKGFQDPGMNSFNHYAFGSVGEFLYTTVAGIDTDGPGFKKIIIHPRPGGGLTWAKASYDSIRGPISVSWNLEGKQFSLDVTIPANTTATVSIPAEVAAKVTESGKAIKGVKDVEFVRQDGKYAVFHVGSGSYSFKSEM